MTKDTLQATRFIYVGPSLSRGRLKKYTVFIGGLPTHLDNEFNQCSVLKKLFVPVAELTAAEKQIMESGSPLNIYYKEAAKAFKEE